MIGLDYLMAGYVHLATGQIKCSVPKTPQITVGASDTSIQYDHSHTQRQLDNFDTDTISPYGARVQTHVGGLMKGEVSISQNIRFYQETFPSFNVGCIYVDSVKVDIHIKPIIYIARDYPQNGCMYRAVLEHEKKHIAADRRIVAKYTELVTTALNDVIQKSGHQRGPFSMGNMSGEQKSLQDLIQNVVKRYSDQLAKERRADQQAIDSLQEYERVQAQCRGRV